MSNEKRNWGNICAVLVLVSVVLMIVCMLCAPGALLIGTVIIMVLSGPICLIAYLLELRKGVFVNDEE
ncbi:MAG: hypothetical protein HFE75_08860 [Firmicutes bacterium]|jgi:hypothetical protein|nr:hypothetical protein [Bacillota bacterium]NBI61842.1 hypothetical protein [Clostridiales bacterium]